MVNITLAVPEEIKKKMEKFPEINWSEIARAAIIRRIVLSEKFRKFTRDSTLTDEDALRLGHSVNKKVAEKYKK